MFLSEKIIFCMCQYLSYRQVRDACTFIDL